MWSRFPRWMFPHMAFKCAHDKKGGVVKRKTDCSCVSVGNAYLDELFVKELYTVYGCRLPGSMVLLKVLVDNATTVMDRFYNQTSVANSSSVVSFDIPSIVNRNLRHLGETCMILKHLAKNLEYHLLINLDKIYQISWPGFISSPTGRWGMAMAIKYNNSMFGCDSFISNPTGHQVC